VHGTIKFLPSWWAECERIARNRSGSKVGTGDRFETEHLPSFERHLVGVVAEAAVCKHYGKKVDRSVLPGGDRHRPDLTVEGVTVEVKASQHWPPHLRINIEADEFQSDIAFVVFVDVEKREASIWGWVSREEFMEKAETADYGYGERLVMLPPFRRLDELEYQILLGREQ